MIQREEKTLETSVYKSFFDPIKQVYPRIPWLYNFKLNFSVFILIFVYFLAEYYFIFN